MKNSKDSKNDLIHLTDAQRAAVTHVSGHVCVSAGAGTGKTRVLVERFIHLIKEGHARPSEILAITFTEKAANEMKARIARQLRNLGLEEAFRELENAYISTIHAFCARLLREHPLEAGVDPHFRVLEEDESNLLKETVLDGMMEMRFQEESVFNLLRFYSEDAVRSSIKTVWDQLHSAGVTLNKMDMPDGRRPYEDDLRKELFEVISTLKAITGKEENGATLLGHLKANGEKSWEQLEEMKKCVRLFQKRGKAREAAEQFQEKWKDLIALHVESLGANGVSVFKDLTLDFASHYRMLKESRSLLDFNDLEKKVVGLLASDDKRSAACRRLYLEKFKFVMIDEFQDTSTIQDQLISLLLRKDNGFLVGDWKQSIYAFRGADASVFQEKEVLFSQQKENKVVVLSENFRSDAAMLEVINSFFSHLWQDEAVRFVPLEPVKKSGQKKQQAAEFLNIIRRDNESMEETRIREARALAGRIADLVKNENYTYQDVGMLFRVSTDIHFYEYELRNLGIPYYVVSGRGFYWQPEIRDLISFLEILENPHLDIPLTSVLRSPLVQISDDTLFWMANASTRLKSKKPFFHAFHVMDSIKEIGHDERMKLKAFYSFFSNLLKQKERWSVPECIEMILEETGYDCYVLSLPQGKRHLANIRKLQEIARELEAREPIHIGDFIRYVKGLETQEVRESEAQVEALEGNVVKLMTVHKAKGLEFRAVFLPDLNRQGERRTDSFMFDKELGIACKVHNPLSQTFDETWTWRRLRQKIELNSRAESKRLFYVAMTRAKERLFLSGSSRDEGHQEWTEGISDGANWYEWFNAWLHEKETSVEVKTIQETSTSRGRPKVSIVDKKAYRIAIQEGKPIVEKRVKKKRRKLTLEPVRPAFFERVDLPVSAYAALACNPSEYISHYELGKCSSEWDKNEAWEEELPPAAEFGTLIHRIFEELVSYPGEAEKRRDQMLKRWTGLNEKTREQLFLLSNQFLSSQQFKEIKKAGKRFAEIPFVLRLKYGIIQGTIDLLYQNQQGEWMVLDYKTSMIGQEGELPLHLDAHAARYRVQMMLYAFACHELLGRLPSRARLYYVRPDLSFDFQFPLDEVDKVRLEVESLQKKILLLRKSVLEQRSNLK